MDPDTLWEQFLDVVTEAVEGTFGFQCLQRRHSEVFACTDGI
jgi:hypothetical protein